MAINYPDYLWLSCGSINGIKTNLLNPLINKPVVLFPDKGCYTIWSEKANQLNKQGYNLKVSQLIEDLTIEKGLDLADLFNNATKVKTDNDNHKEIAPKCTNNIESSNEIYYTNGNPVKVTPELQYLIDKLGLENE